MIPYIGEVFDLANAAWYMKEGNYAMAALSAISALPMLGNIASGALTMFKCAKAAKYVKTVSKVISNRQPLGGAAGGTKSIKNIYKNVKQGNVLTKENFAELANIGLSAFTMICSGKNTIASGKELGGMLKEDVPKAWSSVKKSFKTFAAENRGVVDLNAPIGNGNYSGELVKVDNPDAAADALAVRIGGESRVKFANDPKGREFDVVSSEYIAQAKPDLSTCGKSWRKQTKATFEAAQETGRKAYFQFEGQPDASIIRKIKEYGERYGVEYVIDTTPLGVKN